MCSVCFLYVPVSLPLEGTAYIECGSSQLIPGRCPHVHCPQRCPSSMPCAFQPNHIKHTKAVEVTPFISPWLPEPWYLVIIRPSIRASTAKLCLGSVCIGCLQIVQLSSALSVLTGCLALCKRCFFGTTLIPILLSLSLLS